MCFTKSHQPPTGNTTNANNTINAHFHRTNSPGNDINNDNNDNDDNDAVYYQTAAAADDIMMDMPPVTPDDQTPSPTNTGTQQTYATIAATPPRSKHQTNTNSPNQYAETTTANAINNKHNDTPNKAQQSK